MSAENEVKVAAAGKREAAAEAVAESKKEKVVKKRQPEDLRIAESVHSPVSTDFFPLISVVYSSWLLLSRKFIGCRPFLAFPTKYSYSRSSSASTNL